MPRSQPGALIESEEQALAQTLEMVQHNRVRSLSGEWAHVKAETVCLHGDGAHALDFADACALLSQGAISTSARTLINSPP